MNKLPLTKLLILLATLCFFNNTSLFAEEPLQPEPATEESLPFKQDPHDNGDLVAKIFIYLALFGACAAGVLYMYKRNSWTGTLNKEGSKLKIQETHMLGNKQFLVVVQFENQKILLGVGPGMIKNLGILNSTNHSAEEDLE